MLLLLLLLHFVFLPGLVVAANDGVEVLLARLPAGIITATSIFDQLAVRLHRLELRGQNAVMVALIWKFEEMRGRGV